MNVRYVEAPNLAMLTVRDAKITSFKNGKFYHVRIALDGCEAISKKFTIEADTQMVQATYENTEVIYTEVIREQKK